ncbi:F0F1 ATP synthase subunit A [bacterium]|nr:MAG: F0F1 ATP synthase subunit A [bacterium]
MVEISSDSGSDSDGDSLYNFFIQTYGRIEPNATSEAIYYNLRQMLNTNIDLIGPINQSLYFSDFTINREVIEKIIPKVYNSHFVLIKIIDHLEKMKMNSPFEQFEVNVLQRISFFGLDFSFSNLTLYLILAIIVILFLSYVITKSLSLIPNYWQSVIEIFYSFIFSMLIDQAGKKAKVFFPAIFSLFFFILVSNLLGLIPLSFAVTSHVVITFCLGFGFFVAWIIVAFKNIGFKIFNIFWPTNVPLWLRPLLMVVEILSFTLRPLSLSIRLFVNILAGHILLHLVSGSVVLVFGKAMIFSFVPFILLLAVFCLELGIAFLQAYIFSILLCIYLHDSYHVHGH